MTDQRPVDDEDDWETVSPSPFAGLTAQADLSTFAPPKPKAKGSLRPTAPTFSPKPAQAQASGSDSRSRPTPNQPKEQRVHAPPGGSWKVDQRGMRGDWDKRAAVAAEERERDGSGDEWFRSAGRGQSNRQLWDEANAMPAPPQIQLATPTPLPAPQIKILRRQPPSNPNAEGESGKTIAQKTYAEKEEEYRLARERIFGAGGGGGGGSRGSSTSTSPAPPSGQPQQPIAGRIRTPDTGVMRQPKGPGEGGGFGGASGFGNGPGLGQGATDPSMRNGNIPGQQNGVGQFPPGW